MTNHRLNMNEDRYAKSGSAFQSIRRPPMGIGQKVVLVFAAIGLLTCLGGAAILACALFGV